MGWPTFITENVRTFAQLLAAFAWPAAVVICAFVFKNEVRALLRGLRTIDVFNMRAVFKFEEDTAKVAKDLAESPEIVQGMVPPDPEPEKELDTKAAAINPSGVVMETWKEIAMLIRELHSRHSVKSDPSRPIPIKSRAKELHEIGLLSDKELNAVSELGELRNQVAHDPWQLPNRAVLGYIESADRLIKILRSRLRKSSSSNYNSG